MVVGGIVVGRSVAEGTGVFVAAGSVSVGAGDVSVGGRGVSVFVGESDVAVGLPADGVSVADTVVEDGMEVAVGKACVLIGRKGTYRLCPEWMRVVVRQLASCRRATLTRKSWLSEDNVSPAWTV